MGQWQDIYSANKLMSVKMMKGKTLSGIIESVDVQEREYQGKSATRLELTVAGFDAKVRLNTDSCKLLAAKWGDDYEEWVGGKVQCKVGKVEFGDDGTKAGIITTPIGPKPK